MGMVNYVTVCHKENSFNVRLDGLNSNYASFYSSIFQGLDKLIHTNTRKAMHQYTDAYACYVLKHRSIYLQFSFGSRTRENAGIDKDILEEHQELIQGLIRAYTVHSVDTPTD